MALQSPYKNNAGPFQDDEDAGAGAIKAPNQPVANSPITATLSRPDSSAGREAAAISGASPDLLSKAPPAPGTGIVGGVGGDGFSSLDFGTGDGAVSPLVASKQIAGAASDAAAVNAAASPKATLTSAATLPAAPNNNAGGGGSAPLTAANVTAALNGDTSYLRGNGTQAQLVAPTSSDPSNGGGVTVGGRSLPYGAMVNGVPTFSDGSGAGGIPRTMSDVTIKSLGDRLNTAPTPTAALASDALGYTPTQGEAVAQLTRPSVQPITGSRPTAQDFADSDRLSIATRDPRSALGTAARNLSMDAQYGSGAQRRAALAGLAELTSAPDQDERIAAAHEDTALQGANTLAAETLRGQYGLAQGRQAAQLAQLTRTGHPVTLADGTLGVMDPISGRITKSQQADGTPAHALVSKDDAQEKRTNAVLDEITHGTNELMKNFTPTKDQPQPTADMIGQWREQAARANGLAVVRNQQGDRLVNVNGKWMPL